MKQLFQNPNTDYYDRDYDYPICSSHPKFSTQLASIPKKSFSRARTCTDSRELQRRREKKNRHRDYPSRKTCCCCCCCLLPGHFTLYTIKERNADRAKTRDIPAPHGTSHPSSAACAALRGVKYSRGRSASRGTIN